MKGQFESRVTSYRRRVEAFMIDCLPQPPAQISGHLHEAIHYAVSGEGKRVRPLMVYAAGELLGVAADQLDYPAAAIEMIHTYSLVHDDLPAMDDDDLRRGRPTVHKAFDDATAILVGDALQTLAFQCLAGADVDGSLSAAWVATLARAAGPIGMIGGQSMDLNTESARLTLDELQTMHRMKTGALIAATVEMAAQAAGTGVEDRESVLEFAHHIGMAFQIHDDILDVEASTEELGKPRGSDERQGRSTYVSLLGLEEAKKRADDAHEHACKSLQGFGDRAEGLLWLADFIVKRSH